MALQTFTTFLNNLYSYVKSANPAVNTSPGTVFAQLLDAVTSLIYQTNYNLQSAQGNAFLSTAQGSYLDALGNDHGLTRIQATSATGTIILSRSLANSSGFLNIPIGSIFGTNNIDPTTNVFFSTTTTGTMNAGQSSVSIPVICTVSGALGNVNPGTITAIVSAVGGSLSVINNASMSGGSNQETDDSFRFRIYAALAPENTLTQIINAASAVSGVSSAVAFDQQDLKGNFYVYACSQGGSLSANLSQSVLSAANAAKSLGTTGTVFAPTVTPINISYSYTTATGFTPATVSAAVNAIIESYFNTLAIGQNVNIYNIMQQIIGNVPGFPTVPGLEMFQITVPSGTLTALPWQLYTLNQITATQVTS